MSDAGSVAARQFSFTTRASVDEATGEAIGLDEVDTRVRWLLELVTAAGSELLARLWHRATFDVLAAGRDRQNRTLPTQGHVAAARLSWVPRYPDGVYVPSRVIRVVTAQVMATLRTLAYRDTAVAGLSARFDPATGRLARPAAPEPDVPAGFARGVVRQLAAHHRRNSGSAGRLRITDWHLPTLTLDRRGLLWRCAATETVPAADPAGAAVAVGVDWSRLPSGPPPPPPTARTGWCRPTAAGPTTTAASVSSSRGCKPRASACTARRPA